MKNKKTRPHLHINKQMAHGAMSAERAIELLSSIPGGCYTSAFMKAQERIVSDDEYNEALGQ